MNPFGLPDHQLAAFARPVLEYLPAGFDAEEAEQRLRGRGLAAAVQSSFLAGQRSGADTVWGHIHAGNLPSLRTAQKLGRRAVRQEYFVSLSAH